MTLANNLRELAERSRDTLNKAHNYYIFSRRMWRLVQEDIEEGRRLRFTNQTTKTVVKAEALAALAAQYVDDYVATSVFQHLVSLFEDFVFDLLRLWLAAYPGSLTRKQVEFGIVLQAPDKDAVTLAVVDRELNELKYERVAEWFAYLERLVKLGCPAPDEVNHLAEIKATRDILTHNKGVANAVYLAKAAGLARCGVGERLEVTERYLIESWGLIRKVVGEAATAAVRKSRRGIP